jgi:hypothetical protein
LRQKVTAEDGHAFGPVKVLLANSLSLDKQRSYRLAKLSFAQLRIIVNIPALFK